MMYLWYDENLSGLHETKDEDSAVRLSQYTDNIVFYVEDEPAIFMHCDFQQVPGDVGRWCNIHESYADPGVETCRYVAIFAPMLAKKDKEVTIHRSTTHRLTGPIGGITVEEAQSFLASLDSAAKLKISSYAPDRPGETGQDTIEVVEEA